MTGPHLPSLHETRQLARLRALRVQRARERVAATQREVERAAEAVQRRNARIEGLRREIAALREAMVTTLAPALPRWSAVASAQQERLSDQLERNETALIDDLNAWEAAQEKLQQARAELTRALAREDAVRGLVDDTRRAGARERERRSELEAEDQARLRPA